MKVKNNNILGIDLDKNIFEELGNIIGNDNPILLESKNISLSKSMLRNIEDFTIDKLCNIENTIDLILEKTKQNKTLKSTNLKEICNYFGIFLERKSLKSEIIVKENRYIINYKKNTDENKERFDISYQLGNLFLYVLKGINLEKIHKESNIYEKEANIFAGKLLFPKYIINKINKDYKGKKLSKLNLSKRFEIETNDFYNILQNYNVWDVWIKNETIINDSKKV